MCHKSSHVVVCNEQHKCECYMLESDHLRKQHTRTQTQKQQRERRMKYH